MNTNEWYVIGLERDLLPLFGGDRAVKAGLDLACKWSLVICFS